MHLGGIIQHHCDGSYVDHAVQIVGYDLTGRYISGDVCGSLDVCLCGRPC